MPKLGDTVGRFTLEQALGRGPLSEVFLGVERATGWKAAVKVFLLEPGSKPEDRPAWAQRMIREASLAAEFRHEHVIRVHEVGQHGPAPYLARDFIEGRSLAEHSVDRSAGALPRKLVWLRELARTLADIHRAGLIHRDVKPSNVLIRRDGALRLLDFGVARRSVDREAGLARAPPDRTPAGTERVLVRGTPSYMAPERFAHEPTSPATDQFGWGVLAYEVLAGQLPWTAAPSTGPRTVPLAPLRAAGAIIEAILTLAPPSVRALAPEVPPAVAAVVARALAKDAAARFATMDDVWRALDEASR